MKKIAFLSLVFLLGCPAFWALLPKIAQGAQWVGTVLDVAEAGSQAYLARHPNQATEAQVVAALRNAKNALAAFNAAIAAAESADDQNLVQTRQRALEAYEQLRILLEGFGITDATPPLGGAESSDAPLPEPFQMPSAYEIDQRMQ